VILSCFRYSFNFLHRQNRFYWKTICATLPESSGKKTTAHSQNILHVDVLYNIKRKKYKTVCAELAFAKSPSTEWSWFCIELIILFLYLLCSWIIAICKECLNKSRNSHCLLWRPCLLTDRDEMSNLYRRPSIVASYQVSVHLAKKF
jgi:hypothetical protein